MKKQITCILVLAYCLLILSCAQDIVSRGVSALTIKLIPATEEENEVVRIANETNAEYFLYRMEPLWEYSSLGPVFGNTLNSGIPYKPGTSELFPEEYDGYKIGKADSDVIGVFSQGDWRLTLYVLDKDLKPILDKPLIKNISLSSSSSSLSIDLAEETLSSEQKCTLAIRKLYLEIFGKKDMYGKEEEGGYKLSVSLFKDNGEEEPTLVARKFIEKSQIHFSKEQITEDGNKTSLSLSDLTVAEDFAEGSYFVSIDFWGHDGDSFIWEDLEYFSYTSRSGFSSYIEGSVKPIVFGPVSITTPPPVSEPELVQATIELAVGRSISNLRDTLDLKYSLEAMFEGEVQGATEGEVPLPEDGGIGFVTCGLWKIKVNGYRKGSDVVALAGESTCCFSKTTTKVTIYMSPKELGPCTITFDFSIKGLGTYGVDNVVAYSLFKDGNPIDGHQEVEFKDSEVTTQGAAGSPNKVSKFSKSISLEGDLTLANSCKLVIYSLNNGNKTIEGGISKAFSFVNSDSVTIAGEFERADTQPSITEISTPLDLDIELTAKGHTVSSDNKSATITLILTDKTDAEKNPILKTYDFSRSYTWYLGGEVISENTNEDIKINVPFNKEITLNQNGNYYVTCVSVYSANINGTNLTYTESKDVSLTVVDIK